MELTIRFPVPVFDMERVRLAVAFTAMLPKERFPMREMMRLWKPLPLAAMVELPRLEATVMFPV